MEIKKWSYLQITEQTETRIRSLMQRASSAQAPFEKMMIVNWAYGVYLQWEALTSGWQTNGDNLRLLKLTAITPLIMEEMEIEVKVVRRSNRDTDTRRME